MSTGGEASPDADDGVGGGKGGKGVLGVPGGGAETLSACIMSVPNCEHRKSNGSEISTDV